MRRAALIPLVVLAGCGASAAPERAQPRWTSPPLGGAVSGDGRTRALVGPSQNGTSTFALVDTRRGAQPRLFTLPGRWEFDALSPDGTTVFLIEHAPAGRYFVRAYDALAGRLRPEPVYEKGEEGEPMTGVPVDREVAAGGSPVYTLYRDGPGGLPFVHALNTIDAIAVCVDLPARGAWRLRWSDGALYAVARTRRVRVS